MSAFRSLMKTTRATGDRVTGSETNRDCGDCHDLGQDDRKDNSCCNHCLFTYFLTPMSATESERDTLPTEVTEEDGNPTSHHSLLLSINPW